MRYRLEGFWEIVVSKYCLWKCNFVFYKSVFFNEHSLILVILTSTTNGNTKYEIFILNENLKARF